MSTPPVVNLPDKCPASVVMSIEYVVASTSSPFTLNEQTFKWPGTRWKMDVVYPPIKDEVLAGEIKAFFLKLQGIHGRFLIGDPSKNSPSGSGLGSPVVSGGGQEGNSLITSGWNPDETGLLLPGDYVQIGTGVDSQLHMIVDSVDSNASGMATLRIEPPLRRSPQDNSTVVINNPRGVFRLTTNEPSWGVTPGKVYMFSFSAIEVVNA